MMKKIWMVLLSICLLAMPALSLADSTMRVSGTATLTTEPDRATIEVGYYAENEDSSAAQAETTKAIEAIQAAILAKGIDEDAMKTSYLSVNPSYDYSDGTTKLVGYRVEHMLSVEIEDIAILGDVLDAALDAGANQAGSISYSASRADAIYLEALAAAVENAVAKADALAISSGVWLGQMEQINEQSSYSNYKRNASLAMAVPAAEMDVGSFGGTLMTGDLEISATVELVYKIR